MRSRVCGLWVFVGIMELENHVSVSIKLIMSGVITVGDYELLEKQKEGYIKTEGMKHREWFDEYIARIRNTNEIVLMARVKNGLDVKGIESRFPQLKECSNEHLVRYLDIVKKDEELWVVIPSRVDRIDCYGELRLLFSFPILGA